MAQYSTITAQQARHDLQSGAMLVNGYDEQARWEETQVDGAVSYPDFKSQLGNLSKDKEVVLYCDCPNDKTAVGRAQELEQQGFHNVKVVEGGFKNLRSTGTESQINTSANGNN